MSDSKPRRVRVDFLAPIHCDPERGDGIFASPDPATGFLRLEGLYTRTGVFDYQDENGAEWGELRLAEDVFHADALRSFDHLVVTNDHPDEFVNTRNVSKVQVGHGGRVQQKDDFMAGPVIITDAHTIIDVQAGKKQLSCGYTAELVEERGVHDGRPYTARQTNIRGNHLAIVDVGRAGPECALLKRGDGAAVTTRTIMGTKKKDGAQPKFAAIATNLIATLKADNADRNDNATEMAAEVIELLQQASKTGNERIIKGALLSAAEMLAEASAAPAEEAPAEEEPPAEGEAAAPEGEQLEMGLGGDNEEDTAEPTEAVAKDAANVVRLQAKLDAAEADRKRDRENEAARIDARVALVGRYQTIVPDGDHNAKTDAALMREIVLAVNPAYRPRLDANKARPGYLEALYDAALETHDSRESNDAELRGLVYDLHHEDIDDNNPDAAYADFIARRDARSRAKAGA